MISSSNSSRNSRCPSTDEECLSLTSAVAKRRTSTRSLSVEERTLCNPSVAVLQKKHLQQDEESAIPINDISDDIVSLAPSEVSAITMWTKASRWTRGDIVKTDKSDVQTYTTCTTELTSNHTCYTDETFSFPTSPWPEDDKMDFCQRFFGHPLFTNLNSVLFVILLGLVHYVYSGL